MKALSAGISRAITFAQEERIAALKQITAERIAVVRDVGEGIANERKLLAQEIDAIASRSVDRSFLRAAQLVAASLIALFIGIILLMVVARRIFASPVRRAQNALAESNP